jgi:hypothetical protein
MYALSLKYAFFGQTWKGSSCCKKFGHQAREPNLHIPLNLSPPPPAVRLPVDSSYHNPRSAEPAADPAILGTAAPFPINHADLDS